MKYLESLNESLLNEGKKPWGVRDEKAVIKNFSAPRIKFFKNLKNMNYHLFPVFIKQKIDGMDAIVSSLYEVKGKLKMEYHVIEKNKPKGYNKVITQKKWDELLKKAPSVIKPEALTVQHIKDQTETLKAWLNEMGDKAGAATAKASAANAAKAADMTDLRAVSGELKKNLKSVKGYSAMWKDDERIMALTLPYTFKPTIAKFPRDGETELYIDFNTMTLSFHDSSVKYDSFIGNPGNTIGTFKDLKDLIKKVKSTHAKTKKEDQERFNNSDANTWHY